MTVQIGIVLLTFVIFVVLILSNKVKIDLAAMAIPIILEVTQILDFGEAWSGLVNNSVIMMASMFVVGAAVGKTSLLGKMTGVLIKPGASDLKIMIGIAIPILFLGNFVNGVATLTIVIPMIVGICAEQQRPISKFIYPACVLAHIWPGFLPTGGNAAGYLQYNTILENLGGVGTFEFFSMMINKIPIEIIVIPFVILVTLKMAPDLGNIPSKVEGAAANQAVAENKAKASSTTMTPAQEKFTVFVFIACVVGIVTCALTGLSTWYPATIAASVLTASGAMSIKESRDAMTTPVIWITVGTLPLATALSKTGADQLIAEVFHQLTGDLPPIAIMVSMYIVCMLLTQFMSNLAVGSAFRTLAAVIAVQFGYDGRAMMMSAQEGASNCFMLPTATPAMMMGYEAGGYRIKDFVRMGLPITILMTIIFSIYTPYMFPLIP
mgnify:FL=1